mmetsp:Transcript_786/g.1613  ORF Transcript_786/g.1613 Transcript_786/m.1613 type:complete len:321 (+) Transcript_786:432-1394(+)
MVRSGLVAVVIKGPLLRFTVNVIAFYLSRFDSNTTAVVFSHNNGSCLKKPREAVLQMLAAKHSNFASSLAPAPPVEGYNFRNFQREACYYGTLLAVQRFNADYVFMHRHDTVFQAPTVLTDLVRILRAQPPPSVRSPGGRFGLCPFQTQFTDFYGRFALDDHCMFGRPKALLHFWSISNSFYNNSLATWSDSRVNNTRRGCRAPGPESDNGFIFVMEDYKRFGTPIPKDTKELILQRAFVINPEAWDHVCLRGRGDVPLQLPCNTSYNRMSPKIIAPVAPYGVYKQCQAQRELYDCSTVGDVKDGAATPRWACFARHTAC